MKLAIASGRPRGGKIRQAVMLVGLMLLVGCDPGITVRQINSVIEPVNSAVVAIPKVSVEVKTTHQLIGEGWYSPQVIATNTSDVPLTITCVELVTSSQTFRNEDSAAKDYPVTVSARGTAPLSVDFKFSENMNVSRAFKSPGELRIYYSSQEGAGIVHVRVARGRLSDK